MRMRFAWILSIVFALALGAAPTAVAAPDEQRPVAGLITFVNEAEHIVGLEGVMVFQVPSDVFDLEELEEGTNAIVYYRKQGRENIATRIELAPPD
jgi:hypothetical protein